MRYYVYIAPPARLSARVAGIAARYHKHPPSSPHLTVLIPRTLAADRSERELVAALRDAASRLAPCRVTYRGVGYFGEKAFIHVPVHRTRALVACHEACALAVRGLLVSRRPYLFVRPHITLAGRLSPAEGAKAWEALRRKRFNGQFRCRELLLWRKRETEARWRLVGRFPLGRAADARHARATGTVSSHGAAALRGRCSG
jgi:2'-5' RNA ligase